MKRRKEETFIILLEEYENGGLRTKKDRAEYGKSLNPIIKGDSIRRYLREMEKMVF